MKFCIIIFVSIGLAACSFYKIPQPKNPGKYKTFTEKDSLLGTLNEFRNCYDVTYYDLDLKFKAPKRFVKGTVAIYFDVIRPTKKLQIDLAEEMTIQTIRWNEKVLSFNRKESAVFVHFPEELKAGAQHSISVEYAGKPQLAKKPPWRGGFVCKRKKGKPFMGVACEDDGASIWWPLKDHISDKPDSCQMAFTVKKGLTAIGNGKLVNEEDLGNKTKFTWRTSYPINTYNVTFYIGNYVHFSDRFKGDNEAFDLNYYVLEHNLEKAKKQFLQVDKILKVYEKYFGPYPWPKDGYKLVESPYEGMEHQTAIAYGSGYKEPKWQGYDYIILHETAHEWWGNAVTNCDMGDLWIHEGFATYAEMLYEEEIYGKDRYEISYIFNRKYSKYKRPIAGPKNVAYTNFKDNDIYSKGAAVLAMLRIVLNDDKTFFKIIYDFSVKNRNACVTTEDFVALVNTETEKDYQWFFDQYIYRREAPELLTFSAINEKNNFVFYYKWNPICTNENFKLSVPMRLNNEKIVVEPSWKIQKLILKPSDQLHFDSKTFVIFTEVKAIPK